jgi:hypothetical protein
MVILSLKYNEAISININIPPKLITSTMILINYCLGTLIYIKIVTATATVLSLSKPIMAIYKSQHNECHPCLVLMPLSPLKKKQHWTMVNLPYDDKENSAALFLKKWWSSQKSICSTQQDYRSCCCLLIQGKISASLDKYLHSICCQ